MNNNIISNTSLLNGLNLNPIPLEFSQSMSTTKWLLGMDSKLTTIIDKVNGWYDTLLNDINTNGILYQNIISHLDGEFLTQLGDITTDLSAFQTQLATILTSLDNINGEIQELSNVKPIVELTLNPSQEIYNIGETINSVVLDYEIEFGSETITKVEVYKNNVLVATITDNIIDGLNSYVDGNVINSDTEYKIIVYDVYNNITSNLKKYSFVNDFYYGVIGNVAVDETLIKSLTTLKVLKSNLTDSFTMDSQKILFAYPQSYGDLDSIVDKENFDMISGFTKSVVNLTLNSISVPYNIYVSNNFIYDNDVVLTFEF